MALSELRWTPEHVIDATRAEMRRRVGTAVLIVKGEIQQLLNVGNPTGKSPSKPGDPPRKVTALLFQSIATQVFDDGDDIVGRVGTNVIYARRLELGFVGTDSLGRNYDQAPRPFLRPGLRNREPDVMAALGGRR